MRKEFILLQGMELSRSERVILGNVLFEYRIREQIGISHSEKKMNLQSRDEDS